MTEHIDLVIFDCDGVLIDSEPIASRTLADALMTSGIAISADEALRVFTGNSEAEIQRICVEKYGLCDVEGTFSAWHHRLQLAFSTDLTPMDGMVDLISQLASPKCVASNSRRARLKQSLGMTPLWDLFAPHIYSAEHVARPKPAPDLLLHCATQFGAAPAHCMMIDDSAHGIAAARAANMLAVGFVDPHDIRPDRAAILESAGADFIVTGAEDLSQLFRQIDLSPQPATIGH